MCAEAEPCEVPTAVPGQRCCRERHDEGRSGSGSLWRAHWAVGSSITQTTRAHRLGYDDSWISRAHGRRPEPSGG